MSKKEKNQTGVTRTEQVQNSFGAFLSSHRVPLLVIGCVIVAAVVVLLVVGYVRQKNLVERFDQIDQAQTAYTKLTSMDETTDEYKQAVSDLEAQLDTLTGGKDYPAWKAQSLKATLAFDQKDYAAALDGFTQVAENAKGTYMEPLSLMNAAAAAEMNGDAEIALADYTRVADEFGDSPEAPKALFNQARLQQAAGNADLARATFQQLIDGFPSSEYARLAQTAIVGI